MTKSVAIEKIANTAKQYGFKVKETEYYRFGINIEAENLNILIVENIRWNIADRTITTEIKLHASISRMGGNPTAIELVKAADEISRAALLMETVNGWNLEFIEGDE